MALASSASDRLRLAAISLGLTAMILAQDAGRTATDTKLDLVVDPGRFLSRAVSMWDPFADGGRLQNQAYGYLFPMGPFFAVARWLGVSPWVTQRLWESALLVMAFLGMYYVARALGVARFWPAVAVGLAYALTPRVLSEITSNSAELLPSMVLPLVLLPLIRGAAGGSPRRAGACSGLALLLAGGTNAGATLAILPVPLLWLITRSSGPRRRALLTWFSVAVVLAVVWWFVPLLVLGRYSPRFLDWIEAAEDTTVSTSLFAALRGAPHWVTYLGPSWWPAGWVYVSRPTVVAATAAVAAIGLAGLALRRTPNRLFLGVCLGVGLVAVTFGHTAPVGPMFDDLARRLLDGPLVAFRNVHKFQPLITLPLAVGFGFALQRVRVGIAVPPVDAATRRPLLVRFAVLASVMMLGALAIAPVLGNRLVAAAREDSVADWWRGAARWLAVHSEGSRALIVPGAPFPTYLWGETVDEAIQPLALSPWVVRSAAPLAQPGLIRLLDVLEGRLASGRRDPSLAALLARAGIGFVVVRHDLDTVASSAVSQSLVRGTLEASPGLRHVVGMGPRIGEAAGRSWLVDGGAGGPRPAIEIYRVEPTPGRVTLVSAESAVRSNGTSDALATLVDAGLQASTPVLFNGDAAALEEGQFVTLATDGVRRQQDAFGGPFRRSATLSTTQQFVGDRRAFDYLPEDIGALSAFRYIGFADVAASSSAAGVRTVFNADPAFAPWSAIDEDPDSVWRSAAWHGAVGEWFEVRFDEPIDIDSLHISFGPAAQPLPTALSITSDAGTLTETVQPTSARQRVAVMPGPTSRIRLTVRAVDGGGPGTSFSIAMLEIPGVEPERTLDVPDIGMPSLIRFAASTGHRAACLDVTGGTTCDPTWARRGEEDDAIDRSFALTADRSYEVAATVRLVPGWRVDRRLDSGSAIVASASSVDGPDSRLRAGAAVDGDLSTAWTAAPGDEMPTLSLDLGGERVVRALRIVSDRRAPMARPTIVWVHAGDQDWIGHVPSDGLIHFSWPALADSVEITIVEAERRLTISTADRRARPVPVGISEVRLDPAIPATESVPDMVEFGCDAGLAIVIDGVRVPLSVSAPRDDVLAGAPVDATPCAPSTMELGAGPHRVRLPATRWAQPQTVTLADGQIAAPSAAGDATVQHWNATSRRVQVHSRSAAILVVHENFNAGWVAELDGHRLDAVRIDGWQQGFVIPSGTTGVLEITYAPQRAMVAGLTIGAAGVPALLALALARPRRAPQPPVRERAIGIPFGVAFALLLCVLLSGFVGLLVVAIATAILGPLFGRAASVAAAIVGPMVLIIAGFMVGTAGSPTSMIAEANSPSVQVLCVLAVVATLVAGLMRSRARGFARSQNVVRATAASSTTVGSAAARSRCAP